MTWKMIIGEILLPVLLQVRICDFHTHMQGSLDVTCAQRDSLVLVAMHNLHDEHVGGWGV